MGTFNLRKSKWEEDLLGVTDTVTVNHGQNPDITEGCQTQNSEFTTSVTKRPDTITCQLLSILSLMKENSFALKLWKLPVLPAINISIKPVPRIGITLESEFTHGTCSESIKW